MIEEEIRAKLQESWEGYKAGPDSPDWTSKLAPVLHDEVLWHDAHPQDDRHLDFEDYSPKDAVLEHFADCRREGGTYEVPERKAVQVMGSNLAVVYDEIAVSGHRHGCVDVYRFEDGLIREMWTCVAEPENVQFGESSATQGGPAAS